MSSSNVLQDIVEQVVERARRAGASEADAWAEHGRESSVTVRGDQIEELSESASKGVGVRIFVDGRLGFACTNRFDPDSLERMVEQAVAAARIAAPDPANGLPPADRLVRSLPCIEGLWDDAVAGLNPQWKLDTALQLERVARSIDPRCNNSNGSSAGEAAGEMAACSSHGLSVSHRGTHIWMSCSPVAQDGGGLQTSGWGDHQRTLDRLDHPDAVAREAARRTLRMLGARSVPSCEVPVIFEPGLAAGFIGSIVGALHGDLVYKKMSFLGDKLGQRIASPLLTVTDDPHRPWGLGSAPFDGEGAVTHPQTLIEDGIVRMFLYDERQARKSGTRGTGHARRSWAGMPGIGTSNLIVRAGQGSLDDLVRGVDRGLLITSMLGRGANVVTGDYSRGATGIWIEQGQLAFPVQEITVAGKLDQMLSSIDAVGADVQHRGRTISPSIRFSRLSIGGRAPDA